MPDIVQVKIKGIVATVRYGTLESGDILRTDAEFARHLVEDCGAAEYCSATAAEATTPAAGKPGRKKKAATETPPAEPAQDQPPAEPEAPVEQGD